MLAKINLQKNITTFCMLMTFFMLPLSSTGKSIFLVLTLISILSIANYRQTILALMHTRWTQVTIALVVIAGIACFWSPASWYEKSLVLEKYSKLLYLPILVAGLQDARIREWALHAFLAAMGLTCLLSLIKYGILHTHWIAISNLDAGEVFRNHIMTGYFMAFAAYLAGFYALQTNGRQRLGYVALSIIFTLQVLFVNTGGTGYVVYFLMMGLLLLQSLSWKKALCALAGLVILAVVSVMFSSVIQSRIQHAVSDWQQYDKQDQDTSIGYRLQFHRYALSLYKKRPIWGQGTGSFTHLYAKDQPIASWTRRLLEPHSQYWLIAVEWGIFGLVAWFIWLLVLGAEITHLKRMKPIAITLLASYLVCCLTDSFLFYSGTGYFFVLMLALCLSEREATAL